MPHPRSRSLPAAVVATLVLVLAASQVSPAADAIALAGQWAFRLDPQDQGVKEGWWQTDLPDKIQLPGALQAQGFGNDVGIDTPWTGQIVDQSWFTAPEYEKYRQPGNIKVPFWLQPEKHYVGAAWYQREIEVPAPWRGQRVVLTLERPHWETRVWIDGRACGTNNSLSTPHVYDVGAQVAPGKHRLTIRVDNRMVVDVGLNSHSVTDHTQSNWNGIVGRIELSPTAPVAIADLQVYPHVATRSITVKGRLTNATGRAGQGRIRLVVRPLGDDDRRLFEKLVPVSWDAAGASFKAEYPLGENAAVWDEFQPALHQLAAALDSGPATVTTFGLREIGTAGTQFVLNGRKVFFRGTLECCIFPKTGYPPTDVESWKRIIGVAKAHGLNNIRFHSWCPPEAAFAAADELGFYLHVECASWANTSTALGKGLPIDRWLYEETDRILQAYGNHPSFLLFPYGNEPAGDDRRYLGEWVEHYKKRDPRRLYSSGAGWPQIPQNQFHVAPEPRIQAWGGGLKSRINARPPETQSDYRDYIRARPVPVISHEIGQWCVYPNFDEVPKYTGYLKPRNFEIFHGTLAAHHMADQAREFLLASGKLQTLCYKEEIESALRTPGMGGFQLLDLHDFPGQGTALVGVLDPFWEPKGYVTAEEFRRFAGSTVPLARMSKRVWTTGETFQAEIEVAHFGRAPLRQRKARWQLLHSAGQAVASGELPAQDIPVDNGIRLGSVALPLAKLPAPAKYRLTIGVAGTAAENDWDLWVYPSAAASGLPAGEPGGVQIADELSPAALEQLRKGGKLLLLVPPQCVRGDERGKIAFGFSSIFWNTAWTKRQAPHTLGILCDPQHPALAQFPTESHSNWQWWYLISQAQPMILDGLPADLRPVVQVIDDWFTNRRLGLVVEGRLGRGKLVICSISKTPDNPVARQLLASLLAYMGTERFSPRVELNPENVRELFAEPSLMQRLGAKAKASSAEEGYDAANAIDGDPATLWHTAWSPQPLPPPHEIQIELAQPIALRGMAVLARQDRNRNGRIKEYVCSVSRDGKDWGVPVAQGTLAETNQRQTIAFGQPVEARFIRLVVLSNVTGGPWAALAELELLPAS